MNPTRFQFGTFTLIPAERKLVRGSEPLTLAPKQFNLLVHLIERRGRLQTGAELIEAVWPGKAIDENQIAVKVSQLRKILGNAPDGKPYIQKVPKRGGYRFHSAVVEIPAGEEAVVEDPPGLAVTVENAPEPAPDLDLAPAARPGPAAAPDLDAALHLDSGADLDAAPDVDSGPVRDAAPDLDPGLDVDAGPDRDAAPDLDPATEPAPPFTPEPPIQAAGPQTAVDSDRAASAPPLDAAAPAYEPPVSRWYWPRLVLIFVGLSLAIGIYVNFRTAHSPSSDTVGAAAPRSLAVLPFQGVNDVSDASSLGLALADAVITRLGYVSELRVRPSSQIARFDSAAPDLSTIAAQLHVDALLTGTFVRDGEDLHLTTRLVDTGTEQVLWSQTINIKYQDLAAVQDRLAQDIVTRIRVPLSRSESARLKERLFTKPEAYRAYLKGAELYLMNQYEPSIHALEDSVKADPDYPPTWTMLGRAYSADASLHFGDAGEYDKALFAYRNALRLDPGQIEGRLYMARMFTATGRVEEAVPLLQQVLEVNPNHAEANWELGCAYRFGGLLTQSIASAENARRLDPGIAIDSSAINAYLYLGRYDDFLARLPAQGASATTLFYRGFAEYHLGRTADAIRDLDRAFESDASLLESQSGKALSYKLKDDSPRGIALLNGVAAPSIQHGVSDAEGIYAIAQAYAQLGDQAAALGMLEKGVDAGFFPYPYLLQDPLLAPVRSGADYTRILDQARLRYAKFKARFAPG